jgi:hypothetical protein
MKPLPSVTLQELWRELRRGKSRVENAAGLCVMVDHKGDKRFVFDDATGEPVPFQRIAFASPRDLQRRMIPVFLSE